MPQAAVRRYPYDLLIQGQRPHRYVAQPGPQGYPCVASVGGDQDLPLGRAEVDDACPGRVGGHDGNLLPHQALSHKLPTLTGIHGAIDPPAGQRKQDVPVSRTHEQLLDRLIVQVIITGRPGATTVVRPQNTVPQRAHVEGFRRLGSYGQGLGMDVLRNGPAPHPALTAVLAQVDAATACDVEDLIPVRPRNEGQRVKDQIVTR